MKLTWAGLGLGIGAIGACDLVAGVGTPTLAQICIADADCPTPANDCTEAKCTAGECATVEKDTGTLCALGYCDGKGACLECVIAEQCPGHVCSPEGVCLDATCGDETQNGDETAVDCGGSCGPCADDAPCETDEDCESLVCSPAKTCAAPACDDETENGGETGQDCGGPCDPCGEGLGCAVPEDCLSLLCAAGKCAPPACDDGMQTGAESDVDCGGLCPPCPPDAACGGDSDCDSGICWKGICDPPSCCDKILNGAEPELDCGATCALKCSLGQKCATSEDCEMPAVCDAGLCACPPGEMCGTQTGDCGTCFDGVKNRDETDLDCGGPECPGCLKAMACEGDSDCAPGLVCKTSPGGYPPSNHCCDPLTSFPCP